jgi:hypothetical protein
MKKAALIVGGLTLFGFAIYRYFKYQAELLQKYEWKISGIKVKKFSLNEIALDLTIRFTSQADLEAKVNKIYLDLFLEGKNVGFLKEEKPFIIPAKGSHNITLYVSVNPQIVFKNITDIVLGISKSKDVKFKVDGYADISSGFVSTTLPIKYETTLKDYLKGIPTIS